MAVDKFTKLVNEIMAECEKEGEPVTREEAEEMAKMEMGAKAERHYEQSDKPRKKLERERKVDVTKGAILTELKETLVSLGANVTEVKTETEVKFDFEGASYTLKLTKHRPPKGAK